MSNKNEKTQIARDALRKMNLKIYCECRMVGAIAIEQNPRQQQK